MRALILNSGIGQRMGYLTSEHPKCMTEINQRDTILSRQLKQIVEAGIKEVVITTGYYDEVLVNYCKSLDLPLDLIFVNNPIYADTNYIYSIYCAREELYGHDILLIHGDMVFQNSVLDDILSSDFSCMAISSTVELPDKDFKAILENIRIKCIGTELFNDSYAAQPLYKILKSDWNLWLENITLFCESEDKEKRKKYAEEALNEILDRINLNIVDYKNRLCAEIDTPEDLIKVRTKLNEVENKTVYMCFSTDILHSGHISIINKAARLGKLIIGVLSDQAVISYKRFPLVPYNERKVLFENLGPVQKVVEQKDLSYKANLEMLQPDYVVHGDDWLTGFQKPIRDEVVSILAQYGGQLVEFPYSNEKRYEELDARTKFELSLPDTRRRRLRKILDMKGLATAIEAHSGITGLIAEKTVIHKDGRSYQFDAIWISSLCDSTSKGKPDIELVDMTSRFNTIDEIMEVTTKPILFDGDTGGMIEHLIYNVKTLERMGVSMIIIEDKTGLKKNSLFGAEVEQTQDSIENFSAKISAASRAKKTEDFMICARVESLILEQGMEDAITRAFAYVDAGADAIMIHSRKKDPSEIFEFIEKFRSKDEITPLVLVPTSYNAIKEDEFRQRGANIVIYANQLTRAGFPAMQKAAETILTNQRSLECDDNLMSIKDIITLIPEE